MAHKYPTHANDDGCLSAVHILLATLYSHVISVKLLQLILVCTYMYLSVTENVIMQALYLF